VPRSAPDPEGTPLDAVLGQRHAVRALASELVFDAHLAQDVEQEVWLAALASGPREGGALRGWLTAVVRNFAIKTWRASERRESRERAVARPEGAVPSPDEILAREDLRRRLVEHVLALEEPLREVLTLRFFEELAPREVARRLGLPLETVRTRQKRGLELLRERLEREEHGKRGAWALALVHRVGLSASVGRVSAALVASLLPGVLVMSLAKKAAVVVGALALLALFVQRARVERSLDEDPAPEAQPVHVALASSVAAVSVLPPPTPVETRSEASVPGEASRIEVEPLDGSVLLRVSWHDGTPAAGISATVFTHGAEDFYADAFEVRTGIDGTWRMEQMPVGSVAVYSDRGPTGDAKVRAGEEALIAITIPRGYDVLGKVVEPDGRPVAGAEIIVDTDGSTWHGRHRVARSDEQGSFRIRSLSEGLCWLMARSPMHAPTARYVLSSGPGATLEVQLTFPARGGALEGTVRDDGGHGIAGAQVLVGEEEAFRRVTVPEGVQAMKAAAEHVVVDGEGRFEVDGLEVGETPVQICAPGFAPWSGTIEVREGQTESLSVVLLPEASVEGRVSDTHGTPLGGIEIRVGERDFLGRFTQSLPDGTFRLRGLPLGEFELLAEGEARGRARTTLIGSPGQCLHWDAILDPGLAIRGRLISAGIAATQWRVHCESRDDLNLADAKPDEQGLFEFTGLRDGPHRIEVFAVGQYFFPVSAQADVQPGPEELVIELDPTSWPSVRLQGRVVDGAGHAVAGTRLTPMLEGQHSGPVLSAGEDGSFDLGPYPPGRWTLGVRAPGKAALKTEPVDLAPEQSYDFGDVVVE
jgi:RNA polymerase sigma-70 factor (ECF subfamily)